MILIGTMNWVSTRLRGLFRCPECGSSQSFRLRASRPFLTLYFIPILPIGSLQEYVECARCKSSYEPDILAATMMPSGGTWTPTDGLATSPLPRPQQSLEEGLQASPFPEDLLKVIALIMVEDGHVTESEIRVARRLFENMVEQNLSREELGQMCGFVQQKRLSTPNFLATAKNRRTHDEKLLMVQAIFGVAGADGEITPKRMQSLIKAQSLLELDELEFQRAISQTSQWLV